MGKKHCIIATVVISLVIVVAVVLGITLRKRTFKQEFEYRCSKFESSKKNNCTKIWHEFEKAYVNQDPYQIPMSAYDSLVAVAPFEHACDKTLFWSKTKNLVHDLTKNRDDVNLEKTLLGSVLNGLTWCGNMSSNETFIKGCPEWNDCETTPLRSFWNRLSIAFADFACEHVTVILNGSIDTPFDTESTFAKIEVKRITYPKVKSLTVVIVPKRSNCNSASLKDLKSALVQGITYNCKEVTEAQIKKCRSDPKTPIRKCW